MYNGLTVGAVVPAYNEAGYVGEVIDGLSDIIDRAYVIDDGSADDTWNEIQAHASAKNQQHEGIFDRLVVPIRHEVNRGVGAAIKTGYLHAKNDGIDATAVIAGDGQMDPSVLTKFIDPIAGGQADYAKGNRFAHSDGCEPMPNFRQFGNLLLSYLTKVASGYWTSMDSQNGYTVISHAALEAIEIENLYEYYGYCNELLVRLNAADIRIADVPHSATGLYADNWKSHISYPKYIPRVSCMLLRSFLWRLFKEVRKPGFTATPYLYFVGFLVIMYGLGGSLVKSLSLGINRPTILIVGTFVLTLAIINDARQNQSLHLEITETPRSRYGGHPSTTGEENPDGYEDNRVVIEPSDGD